MKEERSTQTNPPIKISPVVTLAAVTIGLFSFLVLFMINKGVFNTGKLAIQMGDKGAVSMELQGNELTLNHLVNKLTNVDKEQADLFQDVMRRKSYYKVTHALKVNDSLLVDEIEQLDYADPVSERIRQLADNYKGPFHYSSAVKFSVPDGNRIPKGKAAVCSDSPFFRKNISLTTPKAFQKGRSLELVIVEAGNPIGCPPKDNRADQYERLVQINYVDAKRLFGDSPIRGIEDGYAEVISTKDLIPRYQ